jgi:hypothetical protein
MHASLSHPVISEALANRMGHWELSSSIAPTDPQSEWARLPSATREAIVNHRTIHHVRAVICICDLAH